MSAKDLIEQAANGADPSQVVAEATTVTEAAEERVARLLAVMAEKFSGMNVREIRDMFMKMGDKEAGGDPKYVAKFAKSFNEFYKVFKEFEKFYA